MNEENTSSKNTAQGFCQYVKDNIDTVFHNINLPPDAVDVLSMQIEKIIDDYHLNKGKKFVFDRKALLNVLSVACVSGYGVKSIFDRYNLQKAFTLESEGAEQSD